MLLALLPLCQLLAIIGMDLYRYGYTFQRHDSFLLMMFALLFSHSVAPPNVPEYEPWRNWPFRGVWSLVANNAIWGWQKQEHAKIQMFGLSQRVERQATQIYAHDIICMRNILIMCV